MAAPTQKSTEEAIRHPRPGLRAGALIAALFAGCALVVVLLGRRQSLPLFGPDEFLYGHLARSVAAGSGLTWRGDPIDIRAALLAYVLSPAWKASSTVDAYQASKVVGGVAISTVVVPVWLLARQYVGQLLALVPATLSVLGVWMTVGAGLMTENLAFPLGVGALASLVAYLRSERLLWGLVALGLAAVAAYSRAQMAVLFPIAFLMVVTDVVLHGHDWRAAIAPHRVVGTITGAVSMVGIGVALIDPGATLGTYSPVGSIPSLGRILSGLKDQSLALIVLGAILPTTILVAGSARRDVWADRGLRALLVGAWAAVAGVVGISGYFLAVVPGVSWSIERYVMYAVPLMLIAMVALLVAQKVAMRSFVVAGVALSLAAFAIPGVRSVIEERALYAVALRGDALGLSASASLFLFGLVLTGGGALVLWLTRSRQPRAAALGISGLLALALILQAQAGWSWQIDITRAARRNYPADLQWLDRAARGPVARLISTSNGPRFQMTEFFNRDVTQMYVPDRPVGGFAINGRTCTWESGPTGAVTFGKSCGPAPSRFYLDDDFGKLTFYDQRVVGERRAQGRIVEVKAPPPARPRLRAIVYVPCAPALGTARVGGLGERSTARFCQNTLSGQLYLTEPATLLLNWKGGTSDNQIQIGPKVYDVPAGKLTTIRLPVPAGNNPFKLDLPWTDPPPASPELVSARLVDRTGSTELLY